MKDLKSGWPAGIKRTKPRENVLIVLEEADAPLSAAEICSKIEKNGGAAWLSTVYRTLELFEQNGAVRRISVMGGDMSYFELTRPGHKHFAVCIGCRKIIAMENCPMEAFNPQLQEDSFRVLGHNLEIYGICKDCDRKRN